MPATRNGHDDLDRLVLGVLMGSFAGPVLPDAMAGLVGAGLGSVCLFGSNLAPAAGGPAGPADALAGALADRIHDLAPGCLVATDEEGGVVTRLDGAVGSSTPGAAALGAAGDPDLTGEVHLELGRRLRAAGIDLALAPVLDVNSDPRNPIIGARSFGSDAAAVARHGAAAVRAIQAAGVAACVKHFPGHGDVAEDSHVAAPVVGADLATLRARELVPFAAAVAAGARAVMTAHVVVPALDAGGPASTSAAVTAVLRDDLGFDGVVVTDALDMAGVSGPGAHGDVGRAAVAAIAAGADLLCIGADVLDRGLLDEVRAALVTAVRDGSLPRARLEAAAARVASLGRWAADARRGRSSAPAHDHVTPAAARAADLALRVTGRIPALAGAVVVRVEDTPTFAAGPVPWDLAGPLSALVPGVQGVSVSPTEPTTASAAAATVAASVAATVTSTVASVVGGSGSGRPLVVLARDLDRSPEVRRAVEDLVAARPDAFLVDAGWPATGLPSGIGVLVTHGSSRASMEAAARLLAAPDGT